MFIWGANFVPFRNFSAFHRDGFVALTYFSKSSWYFHNILWENDGFSYDDIHNFPNQT